MDALRGRILVASAFVAVLLGMTLVAPVAAAECALTAPATGRVGIVFAVDGSGFPASATIDIELTVEGGNADEFSIQSDPSGAFEISLTPEAVDEGETTIIASAGSTCTAQITFEILGENEPAPTAEPTAEATAAASPDAPRTDVVRGSHIDGEDGQGAWSGGLFLMMLGVLGLLASRPTGGDPGRSR